MKNTHKFISIIFFVLLLAQFAFANGVWDSEAKFLDESSIENGTRELLADSAYQALLGRREYLNYLSDFCLARLSKEELRFLRNEFYAIKGHIFESPELTAYFSKFSWYKPTEKVPETAFSKNEQAVIEKIKLFESMNENGKTIKLPEDIVGKWHRDAVASDRESAFYEFSEGNHLRYRFTEYRTLPIILEYNGTYEAKGNVLIFSVNEILYIEPSAKYEYTHNGTWDWDDSVMRSPSKIIMGNPLVFKFPITEESEISHGKDFYRKLFDIGSITYFK